MWECDVQDIVARIRNVCQPVSEGGTNFLGVYTAIAEAAATTQLPPCSSQDPLQISLMTFNEFLKHARNFPCSSILAQFPLVSDTHSEAAATLPGDIVSRQVQNWRAQEHANDSRPHRPGSYHNVLQSTLLLLKLATLTSSIGMETSNTQAALGILWNALRGLTNSMAAYACSKSKSGISNIHNLSGLAAVLQHEEDSRMCQLVVQLAVPEYCKAVKNRPATADTCCKMMTALPQASEEEVYRDVADEVVRQGNDTFGSTHSQLQHIGALRELGKHNSTAHSLHLAYACRLLRQLSCNVFLQYVIA